MYFSYPSPDLKAAGSAFLLFIAVSALRARKSEYGKIVEIHLISGRKKNFLGELWLNRNRDDKSKKSGFLFKSVFHGKPGGKGTGRGVKIGLGIWMTCLVFFWDGMILLVLSQKSVRKAFSSVVYYVDKIFRIRYWCVGRKADCLGGTGKQYLNACPSWTTGFLWTGIWLPDSLSKEKELTATAVSIEKFNLWPLVLFRQAEGESHGL